jgi:hypothetical protein
MRPGPVERPPEYHDPEKVEQNIAADLEEQEATPALACLI